jgi:hypothetical protein
MGCNCKDKKKPEPTPEPTPTVDCDFGINVITVVNNIEPINEDNEYPLIHD